MLAIGLQGSPRKNGNSEFLLTHFMAELAGLGMRTRIVDVCRQRIEPCREIALCEREGLCAIKDEMTSELYSLLRQADIVVVASPIFFYNVSAQLKALIDRCQALWALKYIHKRSDPGSRTRRGYLLALGATGGKKLFDGTLLTMRYFCDAIGADFYGSLTYRRVESRGQIEQIPTVREDLAREAHHLAAGLSGRPKVLFAGCANGCRSQMAAAFAQWYAGDRLDILGASSRPTAALDPLMVSVMAEKGIDLAYGTPFDLTQVLSFHPPEWVVTMGEAQLPALSGMVEHHIWHLPDPIGSDAQKMRGLRDEIEQRVKSFIEHVGMKSS